MTSHLTCGPPGTRRAITRAPVSPFSEIRWSTTFAQRARSAATAGRSQPLARRSIVRVGTADVRPVSVRTRRCSSQSTRPTWSHPSRAQDWPAWWYSAQSVAASNSPLTLQATASSRSPGRSGACARARARAAACCSWSSLQVCTHRRHGASARFTRRRCPFPRTSIATAFPVGLPPLGTAMPGKPACPRDCQQTDTSAARSGGAARAKPVRRQAWPALQLFGTLGTAWACSESEFLGRQLGPGHPGLDLRERGLARGGGVVAEWREAAVIASAQAAWFDVLRRLQHAVFHLLRRLDPRVDRVNDPDEDPAERAQPRHHDSAAVAPAPHYRQSRSVTENPRRRRPGRGPAAGAFRALRAS